eukprot:UN24480
MIIWYWGFRLCESNPGPLSSQDRKFVSAFSQFLPANSCVTIWSRNDPTIFTNDKFSAFILIFRVKTAHRDVSCSKFWLQFVLNFWNNPFGTSLKKSSFFTYARANSSTSSFIKYTQSSFEVACKTIASFFFLNAAFVGFFQFC